MKFSSAASGAIRNGDLILVQGRSLASWLIRLWTGSVYSHCGICVWISSGPDCRLFVAEAQNWKQIRLVPLEFLLCECRRRGEQVDWFQLDEAIGDRARIIERALDQIGNAYATRWQFAWAFGLGLGRLRRWLSWRADSEPYRQHCAEFVKGCLRAGGFLTQEEAAREDVLASPGEISLLQAAELQDGIYL